MFTILISLLILQTRNFNDIINYFIRTVIRQQNIFIDILYNRLIQGFDLQDQSCVLLSKISHGLICLVIVYGDWLNLFYDPKHDIIVKEFKSH